MRVWLWVVTVLLALVGCARKSADVESQVRPEAASAGYAEADRMDREAPMAASFGRSAPKKARRPPPRPPTGAPPPPPPAPDAPVAKDREPVAERMIAYEGSTTLRVARLRPAVDAITSTVEALGGFVERVDGTRMVVRVPVARFEEGLAAVQSHGDIVDERIFANDVTEAFQDISLRLDTAKATRARLIELLALTEDEQQKLRLIREIERLTEQIDQMTAQTTTLRRLADLSRIVVTLVEREALARGGYNGDAQGLRWIGELSPFGSDVVREGGFVNVDVPEGMVDLGLWRQFAAEAPDGSRIWSGKLDTRVEADADFWIDAIRGRLADDFASAEVSRLGDFAVVTFTSRDDDPYTWVVAIRPKGRHLEVIEAFLSGPDEAERFLPGIRTVIAARGGEA